MQRHGGQIPAGPAAHRRAGRARCVVHGARAVGHDVLRRCHRAGPRATPSAASRSRPSPPIRWAPTSTSTSAGRRSVALYLRDGRAYRMGEVLVQSELADTLKRMVAAEKRAGGSRVEGIRAARNEFYRGETAKRIAEFHRANEGPLALSDLAEFSVEVEPALRTSFGALRGRGVRLLVPGPGAAADAESPRRHRPRRARPQLAASTAPHRRERSSSPSPTATPTTAIRTS